MVGKQKRKVDARRRNFGRGNGRERQGFFGGCEQAACRREVAAVKRLHADVKSAPGVYGGIACVRGNTRGIKDGQTVGICAGCKVNGDLLVGVGTHSGEQIVCGVKQKAGGDLQPPGKRTERLE